MNSGAKKYKMRGKKPSHRNSIIRSQVLELVRAERIKTTPHKGRILKQEFDRLITEAKKQTIASKRNVESMLLNELAVNKIYTKLLPRLGDVSSGYTKSALTLPRKGDGAEQMIVMIRDHEIKEQRSRLAAALAKREKQTDDKSKQGITSRIRDVVGGRGGNRGKKIEHLADTRRVSTG